MTTTTDNRPQAQTQAVHEETMHSCQVLMRAIAATLGVPDPEQVKAVSVGPAGVVIEHYPAERGKSVCTVYRVAR